MEQYSYVELTQFLFQTLSQMDTQFQYWMSVTFGAIVAAFLAGDRLRRSVRVFAAALYLLATTALLIRFLAAGFTATSIQVYLDSAKAAVVGSYLPGLLRFIRPPLFILGSGATVYFLLRPLSLRATSGGTE
jgi:hypothetical protein